MNKYLAKPKNVIYIVFFVLILVAASFLRLYKIDKLPVHLNIDEVSIGYDAYSILKTGRDQNNDLSIFAFKSLGDYKPPVLPYLTVPFVAIFGLNEIGVRLPVALFSIFTVVLFYFLIFELSKSKGFGLLAMLVLAISPWHIYYSRYGVEATVALFFVVGGSYMFLLFSKKRTRLLAVLSAIFWALSLYTYHAVRITVPVFLVLWVLLNYKYYFSHWRKYVFFVVPLVLLSMPLYFNMYFGESAVRAKNTFLGNDIEFTRYVYASPIFDQLGKYVWLGFFWLKRFFNYFRPDLLIRNGLNVGPEGVISLGTIYFHEYLLLILGAIALFIKKRRWFIFISLWILCSILPASLAQNEQHPLRSLSSVLGVVFLIAWGYWKLIILLQRQSKIIRHGTYFTLLVISVVFFVHTSLVYSFYFPYYRAESFMDGTKQVVNYILDRQDKYETIIFDPNRGVIGPYIVNIPHEYLLFYSQYDPYKYQREEKKHGDNYYQFGKYVFKPINWADDGDDTNTLLVGSPWSFPSKEQLGSKLLREVSMVNGQVVYYIVDPSK